MSDERAFIDANIVIYATGTAHPYRAPARAILDFGAKYPGALVSSAEVMQELLNIGIRRNDPQRAALTLDALVRAATPIEPLFATDVMAAHAANLPRLSARDRVHLAVMRRVGCSSIVSTDRAFDGVPGITRLNPLDFENWRSELAGD